MRVVLVVPGGVDPPGAPRVIPFIHRLVADLSAEHAVHVIAVGHDAAPGSWRLFDAEVTNVPVGRHSKTDVGRVVRTVSALAGRGGKPDLVHGLWANLPGLAATLAARRHRVPSVVTVCGGEFAALADIGYGGGLSRGGLLMARAATRSASVTTAATSWMKQHVAAAGGQVDELIPLGADLGVFDPSDTSPVPDRLVHIGNLNRVKDQTLLLHAFRGVLTHRPDATLDIAGHDTLGGEMQRLADALDIAERVSFPGYLQPMELAKMLRGAAVHVLSSRHDAGPVAVLEAGACAVPTVGTSVGHVADFATLPQPASVAVDDRRPETLTGAIVDLLADGDRRATLAARAHAWSIAHDSRHTSRSFEALYRRLTAKS